jgi:hypothetical protein
MARKAYIKRRTLKVLDLARGALVALDCPQMTDIAPNRWGSKSLRALAL